ncbi:unnamed protein product [Arabidopsis lyrata]|uniref:RING-type E3 ubiquitin transferase n=1 Tax=Arabidopsis lyrata subsp. lyrata TaxID=81972 RepID=D7MIJ9_ARALL|nr:hypothetical protein ARALYDRAFT_915955 [Arabidopsis lyrata subsp. lyrata]CAH8277326.1 unnamed protein product [Arabidopsis lyrata]
MVGASRLEDLWNEENRSQKRHRSSLSSGDGRKIVDKRRSAMLTDLQILDCPICYEALTIPNFQLFCFSFFLIESFLINFVAPRPMRRYCYFSSCSCPIQVCNYTGSYKDLYEHYDRTHQISSANDRFRCGVSYMAVMMFIMQCFEEPFGVYVTVSCIAPSAPEVGEFSYHLSYTTEDEHTMTYQSPKVKKVLKVSSQRPKESSILIPHNLIRYQLLIMKLCINELKQE